MDSMKLLVLLLVELTLGQEPYGPYEFHVHSVLVCKGPKKSDCTKTKLDLTHDKRKLLVHIKVLEDTILGESRVLVTKKAMPKSYTVINLQMRKPCDQIVFRDFVQHLVGSGSCRVPKGSYNWTVDLEAVMENMWAGEFFYGNFTIKACTFSEKCNFMCNIVDISYTPKL